MASKEKDLKLLSERVSPSTGSTLALNLMGMEFTSTLLSSPKAKIRSSTISSIGKSKSIRLRLAFIPVRLSSQTSLPCSSSTTILKSAPKSKLSFRVMLPCARSVLRIMGGVATSRTATSGGAFLLPKPMVWMGISRPAINFAVSKGEEPLLCSPSERMTAAERVDLPPCSFSSSSSSALTAGE